MEEGKSQRLLQGREDRVSDGSGGEKRRRQGGGGGGLICMLVTLSFLFDLEEYLVQHGGTLQSRECKNKVRVCV